MACLKAEAGALGSAAGPQVDRLSEQINLDPTPQDAAPQRTAPDGEFGDETLAALRAVRVEIAGIASKADSWLSLSEALARAAETWGAPR
jgi:hypothetical protein